MTHNRLRTINVALVVILLFSALGFLPKAAVAQTETLAAGDIAVILMNTDDPDSIAFVALADLPEGESFIFTDNGWLAAGGFRLSEGAVRYTVQPGGLAAGSIVFKSSPFNSNGWSIAEDVGMGSTGISLAVGGDQLIEFQGNATTYAMVYALNDEGAGEWQADATTTNTSALPTGLINGETAVAVNELDNVKLNCAENHSGTKAALLAYISNNANWIGDDATPQSIDPACSFTVTSSEPGIIRISQVYGGGGNTGATYTHDFIELFNAGGSPVDITDWSVQYASSTGTSWQVTVLTGTIQPGAYYLIQEAQGAGGTTPLPTPDAIGSIPMSGSNGKVALVNNTTPLTGACPAGLVDFVGYGSANCYEGSGATPALTNTTAAIRNSGGCVDTDDNAADFTIGAPTPHNSASPANVCTPPTEEAPTVTNTTPADGASNALKTDDIVITFSEPVTVTGTWYDITCASSGNHIAVVTDADPVFTLNPDTDFQALESCTVSIYASGVADDDTEDPPDNMAADYIFSFSVAAGCGDPFTPIAAIQGSDMTSPLVGQVVTTEGVVVGDYQTNAYVSGSKNGFYIQAITGDADPATSEGIFVYSYLKDVLVGEHVRVSGTVAEYIPSGYTQSLTQLSTISEIQTCATGLSIPPTEFVLPAGNLLDFERYEGMLVTVPQSLIISEYYNFGRYGEIKLTTSRFMTYTAAYEPDIAGFAAWNAAYLLNSITLDDGRTSQNPDPAWHPNGAEFTLDNLFRGGDTVANVTGIFDHAYDLYRIQPLQGADYTPANPRPETYEMVEGDLKVASFNVLNYFTTLDLGPDICSPSGTLECRGADTPEELVRQRDKILAALIEIDADIFGLMEIENDKPLGEGETPDYAVADLVNGLNAVLGAGTYDYIHTGAIGTDAIKQAILYKPAAVTPLGEYKLLTTAIDPRFIDTLNRPTLAQVFTDNLTGELFTLAVNHLKSKGSACADDPDLLDGAGNCNLTRKTAAEALVDWLANPTYFPDVENALIIGDLNSYDKEDPLEMIKLGADDTPGTSDDYLDMMDAVRGEEAYGYVYDGQLGYLDYAMANTAIVDNVVDVNFWHINADEPSLIDYDMSFKLDPQDALYAPDAYRSSDHDPVIITLNLNYPPVAVADAYVTDEDTVLGVAAPGVLSNDTDPEGEPLTVVLETNVSHGTLVLNADGTFSYNPNANFHGEDSFTYRAFDGVKYSEIATVTITVYSVNDAPVAVDDSYVTNEDTQLEVNAVLGVLANDSDVDGDTLCAILVSGGIGTLTLNADGSFSYTPEPNFTGTDVFVYKVSDGTLESSPVSVIITHLAVNDAPIAVEDAYTTDEDNVLTVDALTGVLANDSDVENDPLTAFLVVDVLNGTLILAEDGSFVYTPDVDFSGEDSFTYRAFDGTDYSEPVTVTITVHNIYDLYLPIIFKN